MMAISALSIAHRAGTQNAEALEHYQQVLPAIRGSLQSAEVSHSDGVLFTHYLLLLYEVSKFGTIEATYGASDKPTHLSLFVLPIDTDKS
jgi:hypothetical protein